MRKLVFTNLAWLAGMCVTLSACNAPVTAVPLICRVDLNSVEGGRITVVRADHSPKLPFDMPLQINWSPPASGTAIAMSIGYQGSTLEGLKLPSGGHASFKLPRGENTDHMEVIVSSEGDEIWRFNQSDIRAGTEQADVIFATNAPGGKAVLEAVEKGKRIKIFIVKTGISVASEAFDTSAIAARDHLLAETRQLIDTSNPEVCKPI